MGRDARGAARFGKTRREEEDIRHADGRQAYVKNTGCLPVMVGTRLTGPVVVLNW